MIGLWACRFYHTTKAVTTSSLLGRLRKSSGFSISICKKALEQFPGDLQKAEEWLQSEAKKMGWSKWNKIQDRRAAQGLIGVYAEDHFGVMVEVNCETDFVAKNLEFRNLVGNVLHGCLENTEQFEVTRDKEFRKCLLTEVDLMQLKCKSFSMQELLNGAISKFNEKTVFKRAVIFKSNRSLSVSGLSHPAECCTHFQNIQTGKFGALIAYNPKQGGDSAFGINMCQHIIGMNPSTIGAEDFRHLKELERVEEEMGSPGEEEEAELMKDSDETRLLFQPYLLDPNLHVYNYSSKQGDILDFERFECGG